MVLHKPRDFGCFEVLGNPASWFYLVKGKRNAIIDTGMVATDPFLAQEIKRTIGFDKIELVLLTHSHFDHIGGVPLIKSRNPKVKVGAHPRVGEILKKPGAVALIKSLNVCPEGQDDTVPFEPFELDITLRDGDEIDLGRGVKIKVLETPGHTRDSLTYYILPVKAIVPGESVGAPDGKGGITPEFLADYNTYKESIKKVAKLDVKIIGFPHLCYFVDEEGYFEKSLRATNEFRERVERKLKALGSQEKVVEKIMEEDYEEGLTSQPLPAYKLNLEAKVKLIAKMMGFNINQ